MFRQGPGIICFLQDATRTLISALLVLREDLMMPDKSSGPIREINMRVMLLAKELLLESKRSSRVERAREEVDPAGARRGIRHGTRHTDTARRRHDVGFEAELTGPLNGEDWQEKAGEELVQNCFLLLAWPGILCLGALALLQS